MKIDFKVISEFADMPKSDGWEKCHLPITDEEVWGDKMEIALYDTDAPKTCQLCGGPKMVMGTLGNAQMLRCRDCGIDFFRPVRKGVVYVMEERVCI